MKGEIHNGNQCKTNGKLRKDFKRIDRMNEEEQKKVRKALKGKDKNKQPA